MARKTIEIQLTLPQSEILSGNLKLIADSVEAVATLECRPLTTKEDILIQALSRIKVYLDHGLQDVKRIEIDKEIAEYNESYKKTLKRQSQNN